MQEVNRALLMRREKDEEHRAPITPAFARELVMAGYKVNFTPARNRVFDDGQYMAAGATPLQDHDLEPTIIFGLKELQPKDIRPRKVHVHFAHVGKGQPANMPALRAFCQKGATLIDYEYVRNDQGIRTIYFGNYAGVAGAVDSLHTYGQKLRHRGRDSRLTEVKLCEHYGSEAALADQLAALQPLDHPLRVLVVGTGNVGSGCVKVCDFLGLRKVTPKEVLSATPPQGPWQCQLTTGDVVRHRRGQRYNKEEYREYGSERYEGCLVDYFGQTDLLLMGGYWDNHLPKLLTTEDMRRHKAILPLVIGDVTCDIAPMSSFDCTVQPTTLDEPYYTFHPDTETIEPGIHFHGPTVTAYDKLPTKLPADASRHFSSCLGEFVPTVMNINLDGGFDRCGLPKTVSDAVIVFKGELTPRFRYLEQYL